MTTFVQKGLGGEITVIALGGTARLPDGTGVPYGNLPLYSTMQLAAFSIFAFESPVPPEGKILISVSYQATAEGVDQVPVFEDAPPAPDPISVVTNYGIARFTVAANVVTTTPDSVKLASVLRVSAGRYRVFHLDPDPDRRLIPAVAVLDVNVRIARITSRTAMFTEIRVTDGAGAAADASDVTLRLDKVTLQ